MTQSALGLRDNITTFPYYIIYIYIYIPCTVKKAPFQRHASMFATITPASKMHTTYTGKSAMLLQSRSPEDMRIYHQV